MSKKPLGMSRRELEWAVNGMTRHLPSDPAALTKMLCDVVVTLIEKNNAAIAKSLAEQREAAEGGSD
jgi:hypothetical protein